MIKFQENAWTEGRTEGWTFPATTGGSNTGRITSKSSYVTKNVPSTLSCVFENSEISQKQLNGDVLLKTIMKNSLKFTEHLKWSLFLVKLSNFSCNFTKTMICECIPENTCGWMILISPFSQRSITRKCLEICRFFVACWKLANLRIICLFNIKSEYISCNRRFPRKQHDCTSACPHSLI